MQSGWLKRSFELLDKELYHWPQYMKQKGDTRLESDAELDLKKKVADLERQLQSKEQHCAACGGVECHSLAEIFCHLHSYEGCREWEGCPICKVGNLETQLLADNETLQAMERQLQERQGYIDSIKASLADAGITRHGMLAMMVKYALDQIELHRMSCVNLNAELKEKEQQLQEAERLLRLYAMYAMPMLDQPAKELKEWLERRGS